MTGISKRFPGVRALDGVELELRAGEVHALTGENGSGKSTLAKVLYGALAADAGLIEVDGRPVEIGTPARARELGIHAISQELTLAPTLSVTENILMGRLPRTRAGTVDWATAHGLAREALHRLDVTVDPSRTVRELSIELQQEVEIARAVSARSRVLILDEATSSLSEPATESLMAILEQLAADGVAVLMITHRLPEIYRSATRATVLRDGSRVAVLPIPQTPQDELIRAMVGRDLGDLYRKRAITAGEPVLDVRGLETADGALRSTTFHVRSGEILGVAGLVGSGKAALGLALAGAVASHGDVRVTGARVRLRRPADAIRAGIAFVPDDRKRRALLATRSVQHNLSLAWKHAITRFGFLVDLRHEARLADETIQRFRIVAGSRHAGITSLSGGNQQKVVLGRWFALNPRVLVLSEPTRGIDVGAKTEIYALIQAMAEAGSGIVLISSELPELLGVADRILVMFEGEVRAEFAAADADEEELAQVAVSGAWNRHGGAGDVA
jgi:ABC-type sugar transport system ATPase subunit